MAVLLHYKEWFLLLVSFIFIYLFLVVRPTTGNGSRVPTKTEYRSWTSNSSENSKLQLGPNCRKILQDIQPVKPTNYRIQMIASAPGSGKDMCLLSLKLLTGHVTESVYEYMHTKDVKQLPKTAMYYATHYPFMRDMGIVDLYIRNHTKRTVLLVRNPMEAAYSEYIRQLLFSQHHSTGEKRKYDGLERLINKPESLVQLTSAGEQPSAGVLQFIRRYLDGWKRFHHFWLVEYTGPLLVVYYKDLVDDVETFTDIADYFGYNMRSSQERRIRIQCFIADSKASAAMRRAHSPVLDRYKAITERAVRAQVTEATLYVQKLLNMKYGGNITMSL